VPTEDLLRLAEAGEKSELVQSLGLGAIAGAATQAMAKWLPEETVRLLRSVAKSNLSLQSEGVQEFLALAADSLKGQLKLLGLRHLADLTAAVSTMEPCQQLFEATVDVVLARKAELEASTLMPLTDALLPRLGLGHRLVVGILAAWAQLVASEGKNRVEVVEADQAAHLAELLAMNVPDSLTEEQKGVFEAIGGFLEKSAGRLTQAGRLSLQVAFPGGEGPAFPRKEQLLAAVTKASKQRARSQSRDNAKKAPARDEPRRDAGERKRRRSASADRGNGQSRRPTGGRGDDRDDRRRSRSRRRDRDRDRDRGRR